MNRQPIRGTIKREKEVNIKERYMEAQDKYLNGEFTYDTHCLIQNLTEKGRREPHMEGVQLYRTLIEIAKILMLNELEVLFLGATLQQMKWKVIDNCLNSYIQDFKGLHQNLKSDNYNKKIQLSLVLIGYVVKVYLNDNEEISGVDYRLKELMHKDYEKMYHQWVDKMKKNFKFSPKNMNKLFREMDVIRAKKQSQLDDVNYNSKVDELFKSFVQPETRYDRKERAQIEEYEFQEEDLPPQLVGIDPLARTQSIQSLRSFGRRDSERSERDYGGFGLRNFSSIFRNNSIDERDNQHNQ